MTEEQYEDICAEANLRYCLYQRSTAGRAVGQTLNPRDHFEWWVAEVAKERTND